MPKRTSNRWNNTQTSQLVFRLKNQNSKQQYLPSPAVATRQQAEPVLLSPPSRLPWLPSDAVVIGHGTSAGDGAGEWGDVTSMADIGPVYPPTRDRDKMAVVTAPSSPLPHTILPARRTDMWGQTPSVDHSPRTPGALYCDSYNKQMVPLCSWSYGDDLINIQGFISTSVLPVAFWYVINFCLFVRDAYFSRLLGLRGTHQTALCIIFLGHLKILKCNLSFCA